jgi:hypothetical protein
MTKRLFSAIVAFALVAASVAPAYAETQVGNVGNGVDSSNTTSVNQTNSTTLTQQNSANITNNITVKSNSGGNSADRNTGGDITVDTGKAQTSVAIENVANRNAAQLDTCCQGLGDVSVLNGHNGDSSKNKASLNQENNTALFQVNNAYVQNSVNATANSGKNSADRNTGGDVLVQTGDALVGPILVSNAVNENRANLGSRHGTRGAGDITIGNSGNGVDSYNKASANVANNTLALQSNDAYVGNHITAKANSGRNSADRNTGGSVVVDTGVSAIAAVLDTRANFNAASLDNCGCVGLGDVVVKNVGNGDSAKSKTYFNRENATEAFQTNLSAIANYGDFYNNSGKNSVDRNTGATGYSDPAIYTGNSVADVSVETAANENLLNSGIVAMPHSPVTGGNTNTNGWAWFYGWSWWR